MKSVLIAQIAYAINVAYSLSLGDDSHPSWNDASDAIKESSLAGVEWRLANLDAPVSAQHEEWAVQKTEAGWVYGEAKDEEAKTHPCLVDFKDLPIEQQAKDALFVAIVRELAAVPEAEEIKAPEAAAKKTKKQDVNLPSNLQTSLSHTPVTYIGKRDSYTDGTYGTKITWNKGQTILVVNDKAVLLLKHPDQYAEGNVDTVGLEVAPVIEKRADSLDEEGLQNARDAIAVMNLTGLRDFAKTNFGGRTIPVGVNTETARAQVIGLIDQFGLPA
jgi:hypothetical protein